MTAFKHGGSTLYVEEQADEERVETFMGDKHVKVSPETNTLVHHVCNAHFRQYVALRKVTPRVCAIYDTTLDRQNALADMGWDI